MKKQGKNFDINKLDPRAGKLTIEHISKDIDTGVK